MNGLGPYARIILRYGVGYLAGAEIGAALAMDQDLVLALAVAIGAGIEGFYTLAKRKGWAT